MTASIGPATPKAYWLAAFRWTAGQHARLKALRDLALGFPTRPCWPIARVEIKAVATRADAAEEGRVCLATLLDVAHRLAPEGYGALLDALTAPTRSAVDLAAAGAVWAAFEPLLQAYARLAPHGADVLPIEAQRRDDEAHRRLQGQAILAYRDRTTDLVRQLAGIGAVAAWVAEPKRRERLAAMAGLNATSIFADVVLLCGLAAMRMRRELAAAGHAWPPPEVALMDVPGPALAPLAAALEAMHRAVVAAEATARDAPPPDHAPAVVSPAPEPSAPASGSDAWWRAAQTWASAGTARRLDDLLEVARLLPLSLLWPSIRDAAEALQGPRIARPQELARSALAALLDEYLRAFPTSYGALLDLVAQDRVPFSSPHHRAGKLWADLEPLFEEWAMTFDKGLAPNDGQRVVKVLHQHGDVLPWFEQDKRTKKDREADGNRIVDSVYADKERDPERVRAAIYWAATFARNEYAHRTASKLKRRVPHDDLFRDTLALACLAALRFKLRHVAMSPIPPSLPEIRCIDARFLAGRDDG